MSFSKSWNCTSRYGEFNFSFLKNLQVKLILNWTRKSVWLLINNTNMKKFAWKKCRKIFPEPHFFAFEKNFFRVSVQKFGHCRLHEIIGLQLSQCLSANHNPELRIRCVICTGVTLFALVLHLNCTALSHLESSNYLRGNSLVSENEHWGSQEKNLDNCNCHEVNCNCHEENFFTW